MTNVHAIRPSATSRTSRALDQVHDCVQDAGEALEASRLNQAATALRAAAALATGLADELDQAGGWA
jgi:hypothetical protein